MSLQAAVAPAHAHLPDPLPTPVLPSPRYPLAFRIFQLSLSLPGLETKTFKFNYTTMTKNFGILTTNSGMNGWKGAGAGAGQVQWAEDSVVGLTNWQLSNDTRNAHGAYARFVAPPK